MVVSHEQHRGPTRRQMLAAMPLAGVAAGKFYAAEAEAGTIPGPRAAGPAQGSGGGPRVMVVAVDALDPALVRRFWDDLPTLRRMAEEGYSGRLLPYISTWGNMNFMGMLTGTAPGTHYRARYPDGGAPATPGCAAEPLWQTLGAADRRSLLVAFPQGAPSGSPLAAAVACGGPTRSTLFPGVVHQTRTMPDGLVDRSAHERAGWPPGGGLRVGRTGRVIDHPRPLRAGMHVVNSWRPPLEVTLSPSGAPGDQWVAVLYAHQADVYNAVLLFPDPARPAVAELRVGPWSPWLRVTAATEGESATGRVRFKLLALDPHGGGLQILQSSGCPDEGFAEPQALGQELVRRLGPYSEGSAIGLYPPDPFWQDGLEEGQAWDLWVANAAHTALDLWDWDLFLTKFVLVDEANHQCAMPADPAYHRYDPTVAAQFEAVLRAAYRASDAVFARYLDVCEEHGMALVIASDHGIGLNNVICDIDRRLQEAGLQRRLPGGGIDWAHTTAYTTRHRQGNEVFVNLQGRETTGVVAPERYEDVQEQIIDALLDWRDPATRKRAVTYALKRRDAAAVGYYGSACGDVLFAYNPGFSWGVLPSGAVIGPSVSTGTNHGAQIPTGETGYTSNMGVVFAAGRGIVRGRRRDEEAQGPIPIDAVAPTLAALLRCPVPRHCSSAPIRDLLQSST